MLSRTSENRQYHDITSDNVVCMYQYDRAMIVGFLCANTLSHHFSTRCPQKLKTNVTATVASKSPHQPTISVQATVAILNSLTNKHLLFFKKVQDTTQADTGRQAGGHRQASSQTSRQTYWQAGGRLAGRDRHASQHVSGQHTSNPRASGHASQHASSKRACKPTCKPSQTTPSCFASQMQACKNANSCKWVLAAGVGDRRKYFVATNPNICNIPQWQTAKLSLAQAEGANSHSSPRA